MPRRQSSTELAEEIYRLVCQSRRTLWMEANHALEARGESIFKWQIVSWVTRNGPTTQRDLSYAVSHHPAGISRQVDELEAAGMVRRQSVKDRRRLLVESTLKGRRWFRALSAVVMDAVDTSLSGLSEGQRRDLRTLLRGLLDAMGGPGCSSKPFPTRKVTKRDRSEAHPAKSPLG